MRGLAPTYQRVAKRAGGTLLLAVLCVVFADGAAVAQSVAAPNGDSFAGKPVVSFEVTAPDGLEQAAREAVAIRLGAPYAVADLKRSLQNIYALGNVSDVQVSGEDTGAGVRLHFLVLPATHLHELRFAGDSPLGSGTLRDALTATVGDRVTREMLEEQALRVQEEIHDQGYLEATVEPELVLDDGGTEGTVTFHIDSGAPTRIRSLQITGSLGITDAEIRSAFGLREGSVYRRAALGNGINQVSRRLADEHFFYATVTLPEAAIDQESNTVDLSVNVEAGPRVELNFGGRDRTEEQWHEVLPFFEETSVADWILKQARADIVAELQEQGYWQLLVSYGITRRDEEGRNVAINFSVQPFRQAHVGRIDFVGNDHIPTETLLGTIGTQPRRWLRGGTFTTRQWQQDQRSILAMYRQMGFLQARVTSSSVSFDPELQGLRVAATIDEGGRTLAREVAIDLDQDITAVGVDTAGWIDQLQLRSGGAYNPDAIRQDETRLRVLLANEGFRRALVTSEIDEGQDPYVVDVRFSLYPGPRTRVGRVLISGNRRVKEHVIRRELLFVSGSPLTQEAVIRSQSRLYQLGLFSRVSIATAQPDSTASDPAVVVRVEEGSGQRLSWGLGYSTEEQIRGLVVVRQDNLWGRNHRATASVRASFKEQRVRFIYTEPWLLGRRVEGSVVSYFESLDQEGFKLQNYGISLQGVVRHSQTFTSIARYSFRDQQAFDILIDPEFIEPEDQDAVVGSFIYSMLNDTRPNPIDPSGGTYHTLDTELASRALASETDFFKMFGRSYWYWNLGSDAVLVAAARAGFAVSYRDSIVPLPERFFAGGSTTLRGFGRNQAGPKDPNGNPLGGNVLLIGNLELRFPVRGNLGAALFLDVGNVFANFDSISKQEIREDIGFGIRYETPIGPLRLDVARLLDARTGEDTTKLHFAIGQAF